MPFVDPENSQSPTDGRKIFIGRTNELDFFEQSILSPEKPTHNIISVSGDAGVGKSTLLTQFIDKALTPSFKEYCLILRVGERQITPISMMEKIADQLHVSYPLIHFETALDKYRETLRNLQAEREASLRHKASEQASLSLDDILSEDKEGGWRVDKRFLKEQGHDHLFRGLERAEDQIGELTKVLVEELNQLANTPVILNTNKRRHQRRILLFFDHFEQLANEAVPWLLNHFLEAKVSRNIVLIVAGRTPIQRSVPHPQYLRRWLPYQDSNAIYSIVLNSFSQEETHDYLVAQGITDPSRIARSWKSSQGLPLHLCLLVSNPNGEIDPTKDVVDIFLSSISENEEVKRQVALDVSLFSRPFNQDDLEAFTYLTEDERPVLYHWLTTQFFVSSNPDDGRYSYHDLAKEIFSRYLYQAPKRCQATRKALAEYYQHLLDKTPMGKVLLKTGKAAHCSPEWLELVLALVTQLLLLPNEADHISAIEQVLLAYQHTDGEQDREIIKTLHQLSHEEPTNRANTDAREVAARLLQYIEAHQTAREQELLAATSYLLEKVAQKPSFSPELVASIYHKKGLVYYRLDKTEQALVECRHALEVDTRYLDAHLLRGGIYINLKRYMDALTEFNQVLELDPENAMALLNRGRISRYLGRDEEALQDLECVVEQDPRFEHQGYEEMGLAFHSLKRYQEATDAFIKALKTEAASTRSWVSLAKSYQALHLRNEIPRLLREVPVLKSNSATVIACRADALRATKHYREALDEFTRAIKHAPKNADMLIGRGKVYGKLERYEDALADLTRAVELRPNNILALGIRGHTFRNLGRYEEALQDFQRAIRLSPKNGSLFLGRGMVHREKGVSKEALQDFEHALELDPDLEHEAQREKGLVFQSLKKHQEAIEAFTRGLKTQLACPGCWTSLAETYETLHPRREIPRLLREIPIPDVDRVSVIECRGEALRATEHYEEALVDLDQAIELDSENVFSFMSRGRTHYEMHSYEEALQDFAYASKLDPDYEHDGLHWSGMVLQPLKRYQEAIETFLKALAVLPTCSQCWMLLARTYEALYPRYEIPKLLREVSIPDTSTAMVITSRAEAMNVTGYYEEALIDFTQAIEIEPENVEIIISRGQIYSRLKHYEEALADFTHTIELKPSLAKAIFNRGQTYRHLGRYEDALRDFDHAIKLDPQLKHGCQREKGLLLSSQRKYQRAIEAFVKALTILPTCKECWMLLAKTYEALHPRSEVTRLLRTVSIPEANTASVIASRAEVLRVMGYYQEALADLDHAITLDRNILKDHYTHKGLLFSYLRQYDKAIESYEYGLKDKPNNYHDLYNIAVAMIRWKGSTEAQKHIDAAYVALESRQYTDQHGAALYGLGGLEALLGNPDRALDYLQQAVLFEEETIRWVKHDIAWSNLRESENSRFHALTSDDGQEVAYSALKAQSQHVETAHSISKDQTISLQSALIDSASVQISTASSPIQGDLMYKPVVTHSPIPMRRADIDRLTDILANRAANAFEGTRRFFRDLLSRTDLPQRWIQETADVWSGNANHDAQTLINWSMSKGINPDNPQCTTLGSILKVLLPGVGLDDARIIAALIVVYHLYLEKRQQESIAIRYQIPRVISASSQQFDSSISAAWQGPMPTDELQLQSWLKHEPDMLDVGLLIRAIKQAAAVCRIELPQKRRYGTGFLIAPNLLLTNYHVLKLYDDEDLEDNARNALLRFGCITAAEGKESEGQTFRLVTSQPVLRWSQKNKLDYVLLQVEDGITQANSIKHIQADLQPLNEHMGMHILQHPEGETMKLAINSNGIIGVYQDRGLIQYVTRARVGASGSPCFNEDWKVVALHHAERATTFGSVREGILFSSIYEEIKEYL